MQKLRVLIATLLLSLGAGALLAGRAQAVNPNTVTSCTATTAVG